MRFIPILAALAALAGCAPGDLRLSDEEIVARGRMVELRQTITRRVFDGSNGRPYYANCLEGWRLHEGRAQVVNVTGDRFRPRDFVLSTEPANASVGMLARVRHAGPVTPDEGVFRGVYVTVEFRLTCVDPAPLPAAS
jgi:hypothetical protein